MRIKDMPMLEIPTVERDKTIPAAPAVPSEVLWALVGIHWGYP